MRGQIDVWLVPLDGPSGRGELSQAELDLADRQAHRGHRRSYENAHSAMRAVLSRYTGIPPQDLAFARQCAACGSREHGKPSLTTVRRGRPPSFSLARNYHFAAIAVCAGREIGVDLEDGQETPPCTFAWCHPNEAQKLSGLAPIRARSAALRLWVRREAVAKAMGTGLGESAEGLDLSRMPNRFTSWIGASGRWHLTDVGNADKLVISLAAAGKGSTVTLRRLTKLPPSWPGLQAVGKDYLSKEGP